MSLRVSELFLGLAAGAALLFLPGLGLLRWSIAQEKLGLLSRCAIAPGVSLALIALLFSWSEVVGVRLGAAAAWILLVLAIVANIRFGGGERWKERLRAGWMVGLTLAVIIALTLAVRICATWGWLVPPGYDSPHHSLIVKLLLENGGLFQSWAPYDEAQTFTYHFGFHAFTAFLAWLCQFEAAPACFIAAYLIGATATLSLFAVVPLFVRSPWGGVFAVIAFLVFSGCLQYYDVNGRWTTLAGLTAWPSALVLLVLSLRAESRVFSWSIVLCALSIAGLGLTQYKVSVVLAGLGLILCAQIALEKRFERRFLLRTISIAVLAVLLVLPQVLALWETKTGRMVKQTVIEARAANPAAYGAPKANVLELMAAGFTTLSRSAFSCLALFGAGLLLFHRREGAWFVLGWLALLVVMNPGFIGLRRAGLIDEIFWRIVVVAPVAVCVGVAAGFVLEKLKIAQTLGATVLCALLALSMSTWVALRRSPLPSTSRTLRPDEARMMEWIRRHVPASDAVAGLGYYRHGQVLGFDGLLWVPYFTGHRTSHTNIVAALERGPTEARDGARRFTRQLYERDMSRPEAAGWMQLQGFAWFYLTEWPPVAPRGTPTEDLHDQVRLRDQLLRNPLLQIAHRDEGVYLLQVK